MIKACQIVFHVYTKDSKEISVTVYVSNAYRDLRISQKKPQKS